MQPRRAKTLISERRPKGAAVFFHQNLFSRFSRASIVLAAVAFFFGIVEWWIGKLTGPFWTDPDYSYLLNGLNVVVLRAPHHIDHPGTPVQILIGIVIVLVWCVTFSQHGLENIKDVVLQNPVFYLDCVNLTFAVLPAASLFYFMDAVRRATNQILPGIVGGMSLLVGSAMFVTLHRVMPEPIQVCASLVLAGLLAPLVFKEDLRETRNRSIAVGAVLALAVTAKVTAAPLLLAVVMFRTTKARLTAVGTFVIVSLLILLPIAGRAPEMISLYLSAVTGMHPEGSPSAPIITTPHYWANFIRLWNEAPELAIYFGVFILALVGKGTGRLQLSKSLTQLFVINIICMVGLTALVARLPELFHLAPLVGLEALGIAALTWLILRRTHRFNLLAAITAVLVGAIGLSDQYSAAAFMSRRASKDAEILKQADGLRCFIVPYYRLNVPSYNLRFGNGFAGGNSSSRLNRMYPDFLSYNIFTKHFENFLGPVEAKAAYSRLSRERCVLFEGDLLNGDFELGVPARALTLTASTPSGIGIYRLNTSLLRIDSSYGLPR